MELGDKIRYLREVEGALRGLDRAMTQREVVRAIRKDLKKTISQSYLSQIESGARPHLTNTSRMLLAKFFKVHPGYLVDDPEGYSTELISDVGALEDKLDLWLIGGAERFRNDPGVCAALLKLARHPDSRRCLTLLGLILENPGLAERLFDVLGPRGGSMTCLISFSVASFRVHAQCDLVPAGSTAPAFSWSPWSGGARRLEAEFRIDRRIHYVVRRRGLRSDEIHRDRACCS